MSAMTGKWELRLCPVHACKQEQAMLAHTMMLGHHLMMMSNTFTILLAGSIRPSERLQAQVRNTRVIASDGGIAHAVALGLEPELWVGDFDSASAEDEARFAGVPRQTHSPDKSDTDGALAIQEALAQGAQRLILVGAFGGRTDHSYAIMAQACALAQTGIDVVLTNADEEATALSSAAKPYDYKPRTTFSVLAFSDVSGLTLDGARWPLDNFSLPFGSTLTISNEVAGTLKASLNTGRAMLLAQLST